MQISRWQFEVSLSCIEPMHTVPCSRPLFLGRRCSTVSTCNRIACDAALRSICPLTFSNPKFEAHPAVSPFFRPRWQTSA